MNRWVSFLNQIGETWCNVFWHASWQSALLVLLALLFVFVFRRTSAVFRYSILVLALLKFLIPPFLSVPSGVFSQLVVSAEGADEQRISSDVGPELPSLKPEKAVFSSQLNRLDYGQIVARNVQRPDSFAATGKSHPSQQSLDASLQNPIQKISNFHEGEKTPVQPVRSAESEVKRAGLSGLKTLTIRFYLAAIHCIGILVFFSLFFRKVWGLRQIGRFGREVLDPELRSLFDRQRQLVGLGYPVRFIQSSQISTPISYGCLAPTVAFPEKMMSGQARLEIPIAHELAHLKRWDPWVNLLQNLTLVVFWWNPTIWILNFWIRRLREDCCDDLAITSAKIDTEQYSQTLIDFARLSNSQFSGNLGPAFEMAQHPLSSRIQRIMKEANLRPPKHSLLGILSLLIFGLVFLPGLSLPIKEQVTGKAEVPGDAVVADRKSSSRKLSDPKNPDSVQERTPSSQKKPNPFPESFVMKVVDEDGKPVPLCQLRVSLSGVGPDGLRKVRNGQRLTTDRLGEAKIGLFKGSDDARIWISKRGFVSTFVNWDQYTNFDIPGTYTLVLQKAGEIGGVVQDENGKPIEGVKIEIRE